MKMFNNKVPVSEYGVIDKFQAEDLNSSVYEHIRRDGYYILRSNIGEQEIAKRMLKRREESSKIKMVTNVDKDIERIPFAGEPALLEMIYSRKIKNVLKYIFNEKKYVMNQCNAVRIPANGVNTQGRWHRDLPYQHFTSNEPIAISVLYALHDFTEENGGTWVLPGSHLFPEAASDAFRKEKAIQVKMKAGSCIIFNSMMYHAGGKNLTTKERVGINTVYTLPFIKQQVDIFKVVSSYWGSDEAEKYNRENRGVLKN